MALVDRQKEVVGFLTRGFSGRLNLPGWSLVGACAVAGSYTQENLCQPVTTGPLDHGSQGLAQWRLDRLTELRAWTAMYFDGGPDAWKTIEAQCAFTLYECARDYKALDAELRAGAKTLETLTLNFERVFERSADDEALRNKRIKYARDVFAVMTKTPSVTSKVGSVVAGGAVVAGGVAASVPPNLLTPENLILGGSLFLNALLAFIIWLAFRELTARKPVAAAPVPKITDALTLLIAEKADVQGRIDEAIRISSEAVAELQAQINEAKGLIK